MKVDRAFVHGVAHSTAARAILESSVLLARKLDLRIVAEGVETPEDLGVIQALNCDMIQGFLVSRPVPPDQIPAVHARHAAGRTAAAHHL